MSVNEDPKISIQAVLNKIFVCRKWFRTLGLKDLFADDIRAIGEAASPVVSEEQIRKGVEEIIPDMRCPVSVHICLDRHQKCNCTIYVRKYLLRKFGLEPQETKGELKNHE